MKKSTLDSTKIKSDQQPENIAAIKNEFVSQAEFITAVTRIAHDVTNPLIAIKQITKYFSNLKDINTTSGYKMDLLSTKMREKNTIYIQHDNQGMKYEVIDSQNELKSGFITWEQLTNQLKQDFLKNKSSLELQKEFLPILLEYTENLGLTKKSPDEKRIPEAQRIQLENSVQKIFVILDKILNKDSQDEPLQPFILALTLHNTIEETTLNFEHQKINFIEEFAPNSQIVFIEGQRYQIDRAITNLIRNAAQALDGNPGNVVLKLDSDEFYLYVTVQDTGKGMPPEMVNKIKNNVAFTAGKNDGHGIGLGQVHTTLNRNLAEMDIVSEIGKGTQFVLKFKKCAPPQWAAQAIELKPNDVIIIVDSDTTAHGEWACAFEAIIEKHPNIHLHNFVEGSKALGFIRSLGSDVQKDLILFTDFDASNHECNGLKIIKESGIKRAFIVSEYTDTQNIQQELLELNARLIPKKLKQFIPIIVDISSTEYSEKNPKLVDAVWLEDDKMVGSLFANEFASVDKKIDIYRNPFELMNNTHIYPKNTPIFLDNNYEGTYISGTELGLELHNLGFTQLTLITAETSIEHEDYPFFSRIIYKRNFKSLLDYL